MIHDSQDDVYVCMKVFVKFIEKSLQFLYLLVCILYVLWVDTELLKEYIKIAIFL